MPAHPLLPSPFFHRVLFNRPLKKLSATTLGALISLPLAGCGKDEHFDVPAADAGTIASIQPARPANSGDTGAQLDVCAAVGAILQTPQVVEALCASALAGNSGTLSSEQQSQCEQCTAISQLALVVTPALSCPRPLDDCTATPDDLNACVAEAAATIAANFAGCDAEISTPVTQEQIMSAFRTASCLQVLVTCPSAVEAIVDGLGVSAPF